MDLNPFIEWAAASHSRSVNIKIQHTLLGKGPEVEIWVYDYNLFTGQHVQDVSEIDLEERAQAYLAGEGRALL